MQLFLRYFDTIQIWRNLLTTLYFFICIFNLLHNGYSYVIDASMTKTTNNDFQVIQKNNRCVPITMSVCKDMPYNTTIFPNLLKHLRQEEAETEIKQYEMLVDVNCSVDFKFFLCTMFAPVCTVLDYPIPPCRHLCLSAKAGCDDLLQKFGYTWPEIFNCDKLPRDGVCVADNRTNSEESSTKTKTNSLSNKLNLNLECPYTMKVLSKTKSSLFIANTTIEQCSLPCQNDELVLFYFDLKTRNYLRLWIGFWATICCAGTFFTIITFFIDINRFQFPERAILYMAICYFIVSVNSIVGLTVEDVIACRSVSAANSKLVVQGTDDFSCVLTAFAHYCFTTAGIIWWVILCFSWFLVTTLKWGEAPVEHVFLFYFHIIAWFVPILLFVAIVIMNKVDGDLLSGICSVGNLESSVLLNFVVIPHTILITIGFILFACGLISIQRILSYIRGQQHLALKFEAVSEGNAAPTEKVQKLMFRISIFTALYIIPIIIGEVITYYQAINFENWINTWYSTRCLHAHRASFGFTQARELCPIYQDTPIAIRNAMSMSKVSTINRNSFSSQPNPIIFFAKYLSCFIVGIACAIWTINGKTLNSYSEFYAKVFLGRSKVPTRVH